MKMYGEWGQTSKHSQPWHKLRMSDQFYAIYPVFGIIYLYACLPACPPARPPARLPACLPACLCVYLPTHSDNSSSIKI